MKLSPLELKCYRNRLHAQSKIKSDKGIQQIYFTVVRKYILNKANTPIIIYLFLEGGKGLFNIPNTNALQ